MAPQITMESLVREDELQNSLSMEDIIGSTSNDGQYGLYGSGIAAQSAILSGAEDKLEQYKLENTYPYKDERLAQNFNKRLQERTGQIDEVVGEQYNRGAIQAQALAVLTKPFYQDVQNKARSPIGPESQVVEDMADFTADASFYDKQGQITDRSFLLAAYNDIAKAVDDAGVGETIWNFGEMFIPFGQTKDIGDIPGAIRESGLPFAANTDDIKSIIYNYNSLPAERRAAYWPHLKKAISDATEGNEVKYGAILQSFLDPGEGGSDIMLDKRLDIAFGAVDVLGAGITRKILSNTLKQASLIKASSKVADVKATGEMNAAAVLDPEVAQGVGTTRGTAFNNALPYKQDPMFEAGAIPGIDRATNRNLTKWGDQLEQTYDNLINNRIILREGVFKPQEKQIVIDKMAEKLSAQNEAIFAQEGYQVSAVDAIDVTEEGVTLRYEVNDDKGGIIFEEENKFTLDQNTGNYVLTVDNMGELNTLVGSPTLWSKGDKSKDFYAEVVTGLQNEETEAGLRFTLKTLIDDAFKPVKSDRKARNKINNILIAQDEHVDRATGVSGRHNYTPEELAAGVKTADGNTVTLTKPNEVEAYYRARQLSDFYYNVENYSHRRWKELQGFKVANLGPTIGPTEIKPYESLQSATAAIQGDTRIRIFDPAKNEVFNFDQAKLDDAYDNNKVLARATGDQGYVKTDSLVKGVENEEGVEYILIGKDRIQPLSPMSLHYRPGYVPKISKGIEYLVKETIQGMPVNGTPKMLAKTLRYFSNEADAYKYIDQLVIDKLSDPNNALTPAQLRAKYGKPVADRELTQEQKWGEANRPSGGLFTGTRSSDSILAGATGTRPDRVNAFEAMDRQASHLARIFSRNEWRMGMEEKWLNTARLKLGPSAEVTSFAGTRLPSTAEGKKLEALRNQIKVYAGIPTNDESYFRGVVQNVHDWALTAARKVPGLHDKYSVKSLLWLKHSDPIAAARSAAFHTLLGCLNPVQLFVQSQNATVALSRFKGLYGQDALFAVKDGFLLGFLDNVQNPVARQASYASLRKEGKEFTEIGELHDAWLRSGLATGVRTNFDVRALESGVGASMGAFSRLMDSGLIFYRMGELINRRTAFAMAHRNWRRVNKGKKLTDDAIKDIVKDAQLSMLQLGRANKAMWQGGPDANVLQNTLGLMTQFQQVLAKTTQLTFLQGGERGFSGAEKAKILMGQGFWYGLAGIPVGSVLVPYIQQAGLLEGSNPEEKAELINAWNQGMMGVLSREVFGAESEVSGKGALLGNITTFYKDLLFAEGTNIQGMLGPFANVADRSWRTISELKPMILSGGEERQLTKEEMLLAAASLGKITTVGNNAWKAYIMHNLHSILDRNGNAVGVRDYNLPTEIATALGFKPTHEEEIRLLQQDNMTIQERANGQAQVIANIWHQYFIAGAKDNPALAKQLEIQIAFMRQSISNPTDLALVLQALEKKLVQNPQTAEEKAFNKWLQLDGPQRVLEGRTPIDFWTRQKAIINVEGFGPQTQQVETVFD